MVTVIPLPFQLLTATLCLCLFSACGGDKTDKAITPSKPNVEWKDQTVKVAGTDVVYKFGEGNPEITQLTEKEYKATKDSMGIDYVTSKTELALKDFLSDPFLPIFLQKCKSQIDKYDIENEPQSLDILFFNINSFMVINKNTNRKDLPYLPRINEIFNMAIPNEVTNGFASECLNAEEISQLKVLNEKLSLIAKNYYNTVPQQE